MARQVVKTLTRILRLTNKKTQATHPPIPQNTNTTDTEHARSCPTKYPDGIMGVAHVLLGCTNSTGEYIDHNGGPAPFGVTDKGTTVETKFNGINIAKVHLTDSKDHAEPGPNEEDVFCVSRVRHTPGARWETTKCGADAKGPNIVPVGDAFSGVGTLLLVVPESIHVHVPNDPPGDNKTDKPEPVKAG